MIRQKEVLSERTEFIPVHAEPPSAVRDEARASLLSPAEKSELLDEAYDEYCRRVDQGEAVDAEEFCGRFTAFQTSLRRLIHAHRYLEDHPHLLKPLDRQQWPRPGESFLGYTLVEELGRGAFARVFLAREPALGNRLVALKLSTLQGPAEAETLGRLAHPYIVPVHSVRQDAGTGLTAICMPYLGRATLADVLEQLSAKPPPRQARLILDAIRSASLDHPSETGGETPHPLLRRGAYVDGVLVLARQLAEALAFVHAQGVSHRDLKPSNVLLTPAGRPMLLDFNLSVDERSEEERLGGTLPYMSPEQLRAMADRGSPAVSGTRSDLFSFGVILYELLSGVHPYGRASVQESASKLKADLLERQQRGPRPLRQANPRVDARLARLVERCLAFDPKDRPASAQEVLDELRRSLSPVRRWRRFASAHLKVVTAAAALLVTTAAAGGAWLATREPLGAREMQAGWREFASRDYAAAAEHFTRVAAQDPSRQVEALLARGRAYLRMDQRHLPLALSDFQMADILVPNDPRAKACIAYCLNLSLRHPEAVALYEFALKSGLRTPELHNNLGYSYSRLRHDLQTERHFVETACASWMLPQGGLILRRTLSPARALWHFDEALRLNPELGPAWVNRAMLDFDRSAQLEKMPTSAVRDIAEAVRIGPPSAPLYRQAAYIYARAGTERPELLPVAFEHLTRAVEHGLDPRGIGLDASFAPLRSLPGFESLTHASPQPVTPSPLLVLDPLGDSTP